MSQSEKPTPESRRETVLSTPPGPEQAAPAAPASWPGKLLARLAPVEAWLLKPPGDHMGLITTAVVLAAMALLVFASQWF